MNKEYEERLFEVYPDWFDRDKPMESCMNYGFTVGDGWNDILTALFLQIDMYISKNDDLKGNFKIGQVKEKYGWLCVYWEVTPGLGLHEKHAKALYDMTKVAEQDAAITCASCGQPTKSGEKRLASAMCDSCEQNRYSNLKED